MTGGPGARTGAAGGAGGGGGGAEEQGEPGPGGAAWQVERCAAEGRAGGALARQLRRPRTGAFRGPGVSRRARDSGAAHPARRDSPCVVREAAPRSAASRGEVARGLPATRRGPRPAGEDRRGGPVSGGKLSAVDSGRFRR